MSGTRVVLSTMTFTYNATICRRRFKCITYCRCLQSDEMTSFYKSNESKLAMRFLMDHTKHDLSFHVENRYSTSRNTQLVYIYFYFRFLPPCD